MSEVPLHSLDKCFHPRGPYPRGYAVRALVLSHSEGGPAPHGERSIRRALMALPRASQSVLFFVKFS